ANAGQVGGAVGRKDDITPPQRPELECAACRLGVAAELGRAAQALVTSTCAERHDRLKLLAAGLTQLRALMCADGPPQPTIGERCKLVSLSRLYMPTVAQRSRDLGCRQLMERNNLATRY